MTKKRKERRSRPIDSQTKRSENVARPASTPQDEPTWLQIWGRGLLWISLVQALCVGLFVFLSPWVGIGLLIVLVVPFLIFGSLHLGAAVLPALVLVCLGMGSASFLHEARVLSQGHLVEGIAVQAVGKHSTATRFRFRDAQIRRDLESTTISKSRNKDGHVSTTRTTLAPLVSEGWNPSQLVPAWVHCGKARCLADWKEPWRAAVRLVDPLNETKLQATLQKAALEHKLQPAQGAPILRWVEDPEAELTHAKNTGSLLALLPLLLWLLGVPLFWLKSSLQRTPDNPKRGGAT